MKYSLRSLIIVVTLGCVVLGCRVEYLRRWAEFHEREAKHFRDEENREMALYAERNKDSLVSTIALPGRKESLANYYHEEMSKAFRQAQFRPWLPFVEPPACTELRKMRSQRGEARSLATPHVPPVRISKDEEARLGLNTDTP